jgi:hypothetical protein
MQKGLALFEGLRPALARMDFWLWGGVIFTDAFYCAPMKGNTLQMRVKFFRCGMKGLE